MNKVTHIVNCAGAEVRDLFEDSGIQYLTYPWKDSSGGVCNTVMFDSMDSNIERAVRFIDKGLENGDCVLVHSFFGISRSCALVAAYLMVKYGWKVENALSFLTMAHQDMNIKPHFLRQLRTFAKRHNVEVDVFDRQVDDARFALDNDQLMLRNTLMNGLTADVQCKNELYAQCASEVAVADVAYKNPTKRRRRLQFVDTKQGTSVASAVTTPVVTPRQPIHVDPYAIAQFSGAGGSFVGSAGVSAVHSGRIKESIVARPGTPNRRPAESPPSENAKGRQQLQIRQQQSAAAAAKQYPEHPPVHHCAPQSGAAQQLQQQQPQTVVAASRGYGSVSASSQVQQQSAPSPGAYPSVSDAKRAASLSQQQQQPSTGTIRSPFALTTTSHVRNGSPLPQQRAGAKTAGPVVAAPANGYSSSDYGGQGSHSATLQQLQLRHELQQLHQQSLHAAQQQQQQQQQPQVVPSAYTSVRYASPQQIPSSVGALQQERRTSSPTSRQAPSTSGPRVVSGSPTRQMQPPSASSSSMVQRTSSPLARQRLGSNASVASQPQPQPIYTTLLQQQQQQVPHASATIMSSSQQGYRGSLPSNSSNIVQQRAGSPVALQRSSVSMSSGYGSVHQQRTSSPLQRPSAVVQARASSPKPLASNYTSLSSAPSAVQPISNRNSPRPQSLAEQYLSSVRPTSSSGQGSSTTMLRRQQPVVTSARRI